MEICLGLLVVVVLVAATIAFCACILAGPVPTPPAPEGWSEHYEIELVVPDQTKLMTGNGQYLGLAEDTRSDDE